MAEADQGLSNQADPQDSIGGVMTLREHLEELKKRLTIAVLAVIVASFVVLNRLSTLTTRSPRGLRFDGGVRVG